MSAEVSHPDGGGEGIYEVDERIVHNPTCPFVLVYT